MEIDREFEFPFAVAGVPGVILPTDTLVRGRLSNEALRRFRKHSAHLNSEEQKAVLQKAFERRFRLIGGMKREVELLPSDISASFSE